MPVYSCELCKKTFNQKIDLTRHKNKKSSCITLTEMQKIIESSNNKVNNKNILVAVFKNCLNILRDNEGLTGEKALRNLSYLLTLKLIEQHLGVEIKIDDYEYEFNVEDELVDVHKKKLLEIVRFSILANEKVDNIPINMKYLWDDILSVHPSTKNIFLKGKGFDIQHQTTYKNLIDKLNSLDLSNNEYDILGESYEEVIKDIMTGKVFGQFFTQPLVKKMMVELIDPKIHPDGKIDTCGDPTMGTGGFLITYLQYILKKAKSKNIKPDWDFIKTQGLYGKEIEPDTYQLAVSNMLISSGHMFEHLDRGDSIRDPITRKFDTILANPPFGIKGLKYNDFQSPLKVEYVPIKTDNAVSLFIQAIIYMLNINGKCAIVLPDGQDLFSKTNKTLVIVREYLMKTCDLKEVIYLPSGIFTHTSIKTCVFYFIKKREGKEVIKLDVKYSKVTQKERDRSYNLLNIHQTTNVKFYEYNPYENIKNLLVEVPIEKIEENLYSLNYAEYIADDIEEEQYEKDIVVKTLGEVCISIKGQKQNSKDGKETGLYPFYYCSILGNMYLDTYDYTGEGIIINKTNGSGKSMVYYGSGKYNVGQTTLHFKSNSNIIITKYIYYYLLFNLSLLEQHYKGANQKSIVESDLFKIKIPIPSIEHQEEIVKYLDFICEKTIKTSSNKILELKQLNEYCLNNQKIFGDNVIKTLGEVCSFSIGGTPSRSKNEYYENGNNLWVSVRELKGDYIYDTKEKITDLGVKNSSVKLFEKDTILFSFKLSIGKTAIVGNPLYTNEAIAGILSKDINVLNNKYLYHYLTINDFSNLGSGMLGKGSLNKKTLEQIKIMIPSIEQQEEIVKYCEYNNSLIKNLELEIENNKNQAKMFIMSIINS